MTAAAEHLRGLGAITPRIGIVLGSGLGAVADAVQDRLSVPYSELEGFPVGTVAGHAGQLHLGTLAQVPVAVFQGRAHPYEGIDPTAIRVPVRTLKALGAETVLLTNAAGSLRFGVGPGRLMVVRDHINLTGLDPLAGPNDDEVGPRFVSMRGAYDADLRAELHATAAELGFALADGVYLAVTGPSFETPAEIRAFRTLGADAVGMSTVHEVIVARHAGLRVAALSALVNLAEGLSDEPLTHERTLAAAAACAGDLTRLVHRFLERL